MGFKARPAPVAVAGARVGFSTFLERAINRKGVEGLAERMPETTSAQELRDTADDRALSFMAKGIFCAGFVWRVVENKWPGFEAAFDGFEPIKVASYDSDKVEELAQDARIVRNRPKIMSTIDNARFVVDVASEYGSFGNWLSMWPADDPVGLWKQLQSRGSRLGGFTGPLFLRHMGFDTFMLTGDVVKALVGAGIVSKHPTSKRDLAAVQDAFNGWRDESQRPLAHISRVLSCSVD